MIFFRHGGKAARLLARTGARNLASEAAGRHQVRMRRIFLVAVLLLAACTPDRVPPTPPPPTPVQPSTQVLTDILGFTAPEMIRRFGSPAFQVREGAGLKMQWRGIACVLDAYLYPSVGNVDRVTHVDTRLPSGNDASQAACIAALEAR
jgi:hypothetical protein